MYICGVKKVLISIITFLYLMLSSGFAMEAHYCMGLYVGMDLFHAEDEQCGRCGMKEKKDGCCHDEVKFYKYNETFSTPKSSVPHLIQFEAAPAEHYSFTLHAFQFKQTISLLPPYHEDYGPPLRILHCVYRL